MARRTYVVVDLSLPDHPRLREPRRLTLRRVEDGRVLVVRLRSAARVGDVLHLEDVQVELGLWSARLRP